MSTNRMPVTAAATLPAEMRVIRAGDGIVDAPDGLASTEHPFDEPSVQPVQDGTVVHWPMDGMSARNPT